MPVGSRSPIRAMRVVVAKGSHAEKRAHARRRFQASAIVGGITPDQSHDLIFHGGRTIPALSFFNFFVGGQDAWVQNDIDNINNALTAAMSDRNLNNVMQQYFNTPITSTPLGSQVLAGPPPAIVSQGDVENLVTQLFVDGKLQTADIANTLFNFMLPGGTVLNDNPGVTGAQLQSAFEGEEKAKEGIPKPDEGDSTGGLGGYHGSVHVQDQVLYYAVGVFSEFLPDGSANGIPVFDQPWKNVVATFYHELNEARTDPDVEEANRTGSIEVVGWTSSQGEECGDFPVAEADPLTQVFQEVPLTDGSGTVPVQFQYSNAVHGPEGPIPRPHS